MNNPDPNIFSRKGEVPPNQTGLHSRREVELTFDGKSLGCYTPEQLTRLNNLIAGLLLPFDPRIRRVLEAVAARYRTSVAALLCASREEWLCHARFVAMILIVDLCGMPDVRVAALFGKSKDTIRYARSSVTSGDYMAHDMPQIYTELRNQLRQEFGLR